MSPSRRQFLAASGTSVLAATAGYLSLGSPAANGTWPRRGYDPARTTSRSYRRTPVPSTLSAPVNRHSCASASAGPAEKRRVVRSYSSIVDDLVGVDIGVLVVFVVGGLLVGASAGVLSLTLIRLAGPFSDRVHFALPLVIGGIPTAVLVDSFGIDLLLILVLTELVALPVTGLLLRRRYSDSTRLSTSVQSSCTRARVGYERVVVTYGSGPSIAGVDSDLFGPRATSHRKNLCRSSVGRRMFGDANPTGAFSGMQAVLLAILVLALVATVGVYLLGVPIDLLWLVFLVVFVGLLALAIPRFKRAQPSKNREN